MSNKFIDKSTSTTGFAAKEHQASLKLLDLDIKLANSKTLIQKAKRLFCVDAVIIFGFDESNRQLFELSGSSDHNDTLAFHCHGILDILEHEKKTLLIDGEFLYQNKEYKKYNDQNSVEIYVPVFKEYENNKRIIGLIYFESQSKPDINLFNSTEFRKLIYEFYTLLTRWYNLARKKEKAYHVAYLLCEIIDNKEPYLISRLFNIAYWCVKIAQKLGLPQEDIEKLEIATLMHDLGKIYISEDILNKKGKLTAQEYEIIKKRVVYSYDIAEEFKELNEIYDLPDIILNCQERIDGKGYPNGKKGDEIPLLSKILGTAKAVSSMLTNTSYSPAKTIVEVINELKLNSDKQFDKDVADAAIVVLATERKYSEDYLTGMGAFATFNMRVVNNDQEENMIIWGNLKKKDDAYVFTPLVKILDDENLIIQACSLYISFNDQIIHYNPTIKRINEDIIEFSHLELDKENNVFAINWLLQGLLVTPSRSVYEIFATKIGGNHIDFYIFSKNLREDISEGVVKLTFEDGNKITLPGIVTSSDKIDDRVLFRFKYIGIQHEDMKLVYAELFKKQIALRNILNKLI